MMQQKNILFVLFSFLLGANSFCQKDSLTNKKKCFYINVGINNSIPKVESYYFINEVDTNVADGFSEHFQVFPKFSTGANVLFGFQLPIVRFQKLKISLYPEIGINYYTKRKKSVGSYYNWFAGIAFNGTIFSTQHIYSTSLAVLSSFSYPLNNTIDLTLYLGAGVDCNFFNTYKGTEENIILNTKTNYRSKDKIRFFYADYFFLSSYRFEISKNLMNMQYGIFVGTTFLGKRSFTDKLFVLNYGLTYKF